MDGDDDDRILGLTVQNPDNSLHNKLNAVAAATATDGEGEEGKEEQGEEEFLDLGPPTDDDDDEKNDNNDDDDDGSDAMAGESSHGDDNGSNASNEDDVGSENNAPLSDEALMRIESKSEAKALGGKLYKRWKKLYKRSKKEKHRHGSKKKSKREDKKHKEKKNEKKRKRRRTDDEDDDDDHDDEDNDFEDDMEEEEEKEGKRKGSNSKRQRKSSRHEKPIALGDEDLGSAPFANLDEVLLAEEAAARRSGGRSGKGSSSSNNNNNNNLVSEVKAKKLSADAQRGALRAMAAAVVNSMREARLQDEVDMNQRRPPLHRVSILDKVVAQCRREALRPFLIEEGILQELSTWLYDFNRRELAAFELRSAALDILLGFPIDGELNAGIARNGDEILDAFTGMTREHLINTDLGSAVNALRQDKHEVHQNRSKAVRLLERLSRAMSGGVKSARRSGDGSGNSSFAGGSGASSSNVTWKCQDDPTVAPPFHMVQTGTEAFQTALVRPDPLDPLSYLRVPPRRAPKAYVTNLGGNVGVGE